MTTFHVHIDSSAPVLEACFRNLLGKIDKQTRSVNLYGDLAFGQLRSVPDNLDGFGCALFDALDAIATIYRTVWTQTVPGAAGDTNAHDTLVLMTGTSSRGPYNSHKRDIDVIEIYGPSKRRKCGDSDSTPSGVTAAHNPGIRQYVTSSVSIRPWAG